MSRLLIIQTAQVILIIFFALSGIVVVQEIAQEAQNFQDNLQPGYPDWVRTVTESICFPSPNFAHVILKQVYTFVPTPQQAQAALYPAVGVAVFAMITIFLIYIPR